MLNTFESDADTFKRWLSVRKPSRCECSLHSCYKVKYQESDPPLHSCYKVNYQE